VLQGVGKIQPAALNIIEWPSVAPLCFRLGQEKPAVNLARLSLRAFLFYFIGARKRRFHFYVFRNSACAEASGKPENRRRRRFTANAVCGTSL